MQFQGTTTRVMDYGDMNWLAIVCAGLAYWLLGAVWYSALFSKAWRSAIEQHGVKLGQPNQSGMGTKLIVTLVCNLIAALVLARVIHQLHGVNLLRGVKIGAGVGIGFCATALTMTYVCNRRRGDSGRSTRVIISSAAL
jgi:Protein of unknown function (DUF1761)